MIASLFVLLLAQSPPVPSPSPLAVPSYVVSIVSERSGNDAAIRFVLSGPPNSYSAVREGDDIVVRIAAEPLGGLSVPSGADPIRSIDLVPGAEFTARVRLTERREHEILREVSALRLILRAKAQTAAPQPAANAAAAPAAVTAPTPERTPNTAADTAAMDTADLYRRLFPSSSDPSGSGRPVEIGDRENWYSDFSWLGIQARPWVSVSYVDGKTTEVASNTVTADSYWVIQPNLGIGLSPSFGAAREGQWKMNYTPRFRRQVDLNLPRLTSHFFDVGIDQPVASFGSLYGNYHFSKGILETEEIDPGREYGIGLNRVVDTSLERFKRHSFGFGVRFDFVADTQADINLGRTKVSYGNVAEDAPFRFGDRAFFDYETRTLNASLRRAIGEGRFFGVSFAIHDTPQQEERAQIEGRGYTYAASLEGEIAALTNGRVTLGYRTQKNPNAGEGGRDYKDLTYGAQLVREITDDASLGLGADRKLYLSAYGENGFYVADSIRGDLNTKIPFDFFLRGSGSFQSNGYRASPQSNTGSTERVLRKDGLITWSIGLSRSVARWAYLRFDYTAERRNSNLDRFDIKTRSITFQVGLGYFGKPGSSQVQSTW
jgi:hypothetical protein